MYGRFKLVTKNLTSIYSTFPLISPFFNLEKYKEICKETYRNTSLTLIKEAFWGLGAVFSDLSKYENPFTAKSYKQDSHRLQDRKKSSDFTKDLLQPLIGLKHILIAALWIIPSIFVLAYTIISTVARIFVPNTFDIDFTVAGLMFPIDKVFSNLVVGCEKLITTPITYLVKLPSKKISINPDLSAKKIDIAILKELDNIQVPEDQTKYTPLKSYAENLLLNSKVRDLSLDKFNKADQATWEDIFIATSKLRNSIDNEWYR